MRIHFLLTVALICLLFLVSCEKEETGPPLFPGEKIPQFEIGSIQFDSKIDDPDFQLCEPDRVYEYYQTRARFGEGLKSVRDHFAGKLPSLPASDTLHGYVTIRFVVNCKGEKGWYRSFQTDSSYQPVAFQQTFVDSLQSLVEAMPNWKPGARKDYPDKTLNSYCFVTFKIRNGTVIDLLP